MDMMEWYIIIGMECNESNNVMYGNNGSEWRLDMFIRFNSVESSIGI